jgi:hypothetical protein
MRSINCQTARREIESAGFGEHLNDAAIAHLSVCDSCATLARQQGRLQTLLANLGTVEAPGDFDFKLRARLSAERGASAGPSFWMSFSFGQRSAATAMALVLIVAGVAFFSLRQPSDSNVAIPPVNPNVQLVASGGAGAISTVDKTTADSMPVRSKVQPSRRNNGSPAYVAIHNGGRPKSKDLSATSAKVFKYDQVADPYPSGAFPINASYQSLKVSIDDGHSTRTISLPSVSFGSQPALSQTQPLVASARGSW